MTSFDKGERPIIPQPESRDIPRLLISAPGRLPSWTLREIVTVVFRRKWLLLALFGTIAVLTIALALLLPNQYQSRMRILVKNARADVVITPERTNSPNTGGEVTETQINSEIALLTSKDLFEQVVRQSGLDKQAPSSFGVRTCRQLKERSFNWKRISRSARPGRPTS